MSLPEDTYICVECGTMYADFARFCQGCSSHDTVKSLKEAAEELDAE